MNQLYTPPHPKGKKMKNCYSVPKNGTERKKMKKPEKTAPCQG